MGYFLIAGSFTYSFYSILKNDMTTGKRKAQDLGGMALTATTSVGTSIIGGIIGQTLIPIPVFGALVGSVIGGFIGERGCRKITKII